VFFCSRSSPGYGQEKPAPTPVEPPTATAPAPSSPAWGPGLEWSPHKPSLEIEPDLFANADIALAFPHLDALLIMPVGLSDGRVLPAVLRSASLDPTVSPRIQIGALKFGPDYGALALEYSFLASEGSDTSNAGTVRSRVNLQTFSLDYLRDCHNLGWDIQMSWDVGARLQVAFFDTQLRTDAVAEQGRNYFFGAGAHGGVTLNRTLPSGWGLFARFDVGLLGGYNTDQNFVVTLRDPRGGILSGTESQQQSQFAPSLAVQTGVSWTPAWLRTSHLRAGYQFEQWYNLGRVGQSRGDLYSHGLFLGVACEF
jgi:hypothetical protein